MGMERGHRFEVPFEQAFPAGLVLNGQVEPDNEFQENRNAPPRQKVDEATGLRRWKAVFSDPGYAKEAEASIKVIFLSDVQPVPTTEEFMPGCGMRPVVLEGLQVSPVVTGQDKFKRLGWMYFATGFAAAQSSPGGSSAGKSAGRRSGESSASQAEAA
ncbi:hypothetical protein LY13_004473 [Prauserella aidingensis]|uniref:hypothetical protein n=1 Tax=Prauserella aidingensis TaxID=387890 RepID=UPI0020A3BFD9|nr:hypothetical protein [Prauserella aidingensis]MCP2255692.1 hypothetical protein [Prauserella aidingensis]